MSETEKFENEVALNIRGLGQDKDVQALSRIWAREVTRHRYNYNFAWMGRPIIQVPQDMVAIQELIWRVKPDLVIETGIAHGGSIVMSASLLAMLDYCDAVELGRPLDPRAPGRQVLAVDVDIRPHNRAAIEAHPMAHRIEMIQGSSVAIEIVAKVRAISSRFNRVLVSLDSNHTHAHVLAELEAYAPLVSAGSYCVVFDTLIEQMPDDIAVPRPWGPGNNPMTAVDSFISKLAAGSVTASDGQRLAFEIDTDMDSKLLISAAPRGFLRRISI
jgi:cephalosporin hydroxylase